MLLKSGIDSSWFEMKVLLGSILNKEPKQILFTEALNDEQQKQFAEMIQQRLTHRPADKIIGEKGFYKFNFAVDENVLSPRADSEILTQAAIALLNSINKAKILELGVGSGCLILSILAEITTATGTGIDISKTALRIAQTNAVKLGISSQRITFYHKSWFDEDITNFFLTDGLFDMIISNPPYIPTSEIALLDEEVKNYDPLLALDGGEDGMRDYRQILPLASKMLKRRGYLLLEAGGSDQLKQISSLALNYQLQTLDILKDLNGNERCIILKK